MKEMELYGGIAAHASAAELTFIENTASPVRLFVSAHRGISRQPVVMDALLGFPSVWTLDRMVRVYALMKMEAAQVESLWDTAEINEAVALYSSLFYLEHAERWILRATDAVRSNIGDVFDALAFENLYPEAYFSEAQWNQLVLKCIFNDKGIHRIRGLERRKNAALAQSISDFAHERWAAGRHVPPQVWRLVQGFVDEGIEKDLEVLSRSERWEDRCAYALVTSGSFNKDDQPLSWAALEIE
jgi:hypothetical protein